MSGSENTRRWFVADEQSKFACTTLGATETIRDLVVRDLDALAERVAKLEHSVVWAASFPPASPAAPGEDDEKLVRWLLINSTATYGTKEEDLIRNAVRELRRLGRLA